MEELIRHIQTISKNKKRFVISIDGPAASGKSTLSKYLEEKLGATVFRMDDYFLPDEMKTEERLSVPGGNVHYERMQEEVLDHLSQEEVTYKKYDCSLSELSSPVTQTLGKYVVIEGVYSQQSILRKYYDFNIFTITNKEGQHDRLYKRNPKLFSRFINEWLPLEDEYFTKEKIREQSDYQTEVIK